jgi:hypothetical protein
VSTMDRNRCPLSAESAVGRNCGAATIQGAHGNGWPGRFQSVRLAARSAASRAKRSVSSGMELPGEWVGVSCVSAMEEATEQHC